MPKSISASLSLGHENKYVKTMGDTLILTATQNIAQSAHEETQGENRGNFRTIMELEGKHVKQ